MSGRHGSGSSEARVVDLALAGGLPAGSELATLVSTDELTGAHQGSIATTDA
jgi:hypothetical protein